MFDIFERSDALGHVFNMIGRDWTHPGVAKLYTDIASNGYRFMYLTSRAVGQADQTREYLRGIHQDGYELPEGPVIMSPDRLFTSLHRYADCTSCLYVPNVPNVPLLQRGGAAKARGVQDGLPARH